MNLGPQFALPGMEEMRPAEPHEQTPAQFHNRPDVFVHGRLEWPEVPHNQPPKQRAWDFHAGTSQSAIERMNDFGTPRQGKEPRFYAGQIHPGAMQNPPPAEGPHYHPDQVVLHKGDNRYMTRVAEPASNEWRIKDPGEDWDPADVDSYYRNDHEDVGSTSVIVGSYGVSVGQNFRSWRTSVHDALEHNKRVPHHVKSVYEQSGGAEGPVTHVESEYQRPRLTTTLPTQTTLPYDAHMFRLKRYKGLTVDETDEIDKARGL